MSDASCDAGLVITRYGAGLEVEDPFGRSHRCTARKRCGDLVCGDRVRWRRGHGGECVVVERDPRSTLLARPDQSGKLKPVAANIDQLIVVVAPTPELDEDLIDRYLVAAETIGIKPVIFLNKVDLLAATQLSSARERLAVYAGIGYVVVNGSAKRERGLDALGQHLQGQTTVLVGRSGVGKSAIIARLLPDVAVRVGAVSQATGLGRHTTSATRLYHLPGGGRLIDSPGVREFGLWHVTDDEAMRGFVEFRDYLGRCRFNDCRHRTEPGCAIRQAVAEGDIARRRLESYHRILASLESGPG